MLLPLMMKQNSFFELKKAKEVDRIGKYTNKKMSKNEEESYYNGEKETVKFVILTIILLLVKNKAGINRRNS